MTRADSWTAEEEAWLRDVYPTHHNGEIAEMHAARFPDRPRRTASAVNSRAKVYGLHKADGFQRKPPTFWTPEKVEWFSAFVPGHHEAEISAEHERIYGTPLTEGQIGNAKARFGVRSGTDGGQFRKGSEPANKGKTWDEMGISEEAKERMRANQYKPGQVHVAPSRERHVGYERVDKDGFTLVKVRDSRVDGLQRKHAGHFNENYRMKHHVVYEQAHGPIPDGHNVVFADHDKTNFDPSNLVAVPRSLWSTIKRKRIEYWDAESLRTAMLVAKVDQARHAAECRPRKCRKCGAEFEARYPHQRTCDACLGR